MESRNRYTGMPPCAVNSVRHQARKLARSHGFLPADVEDIEQEMMIHLHRQIPRYDDAKSSTATFISRLIGNHAISLQRSAMAYGLGALPVVSLHEHAQDEEGNTIELIESIFSDCSLWPSHGLAWHEVAENRVDAFYLLKRLPPSLRQLAIWFMSSSVMEVARTKGISRHAMYEGISKMRQLVGQT